jgi:hypothetical protein
LTRSIEKLSGTTSPRSSDSTSKGILKPHTCQF